MTPTLVSTKAYGRGTVKMENNDVKHTIDAASALVAFSTLMQWLPVVASALTIIWYLIRIGEYIYGKIKGKDLDQNA
jgi:hypothetical protein